MKGNKYKRKGWHGESHRHYLASKGVKTGRKKNRGHFAGKKMWAMQNDKWMDSEIQEDDSDAMAHKPGHGDYDESLPARMVEGAVRRGKDGMVPDDRNKPFMGLANVIDNSFDLARGSTETAVETTGDVARGTVRQTRKGTRGVLRQFER